MARSPAVRRYARALFELAQERGCLDNVQADLAEIARLVSKRAEFTSLMERHDLSPENRKNIWTQILEDKANPLTLRFLHFLINKRRLPLLGEIIRDFDLLFNEAKGITTIQVISAEPLQEEQLQALSARFALKLGRTIKAVQNVNRALLGGFQVRVGDVVYDFSVNHQLETLYRKMITA